MKQHESIKIEDLPVVNELYQPLLTHYEQTLELIDEDYTLDDCKELCSEQSCDEGVCWCSIAQFKRKFSQELRNELCAYNTCGGYIYERPRLCSTKEMVVASLQARIEVMKLILSL